MSMLFDKDCQSLKYSLSLTNTGQAQSTSQAVALLRNVKWATIHKYAQDLKISVLKD